MKRVRYAVVGGGQIPRQAFMPGIARTNDAQRVALATGDPVKADGLADLYGTLPGSAEIDAVDIATPGFPHMRYAVPALDGGIHALPEKPANLRGAEIIRPQADDRIPPASRTRHGGDDNPRAAQRIRRTAGLFVDPRAERREGELA